VLKVLDFTEKAGLDRVKQTLSDIEGQKYLHEDYQVRIVKYVPNTSRAVKTNDESAWRPLYRPVKDAALAFCDPSTVRAEDLLEVDTASADTYSESYYLKYQPHLQFYWCSHQTPNEISFFTSWDSEASGGLKGKFDRNIFRMLFLVLTAH
jgi:hypothetical protein